MNFLSVCSGIEAASVAWKPLGWKAVGFSEIEPFPCAVLAHHYPAVRNFGDLTKWESWINDVADFDVLAGGTPCQGFSVAGRRGGLEDPRSQLAFDFLGIAGRRKPEWIVWENVPGVLSSGGGRDFGAFLGELGKCGYGFAYRVLDAQYFGLAQRRKRVFVVGYLGDWRPAAAVLLEPESLRGDIAPSREAGQGTARDVAARLRSGGAGTSRVGDTRGQDNVIAIQEVGKRQSGTPQNGVGYSEPGAPMYTLQAGVQHAVAAPITASYGKQVDSSDTSNGPPNLLVTHALRAECHDASEDGTGRGVPLTAMCLNAGGMGRIDGESETMIPCCFKTDQEPEAHGDLCPTLQVPSRSGGGQQHAVAFAQNQRGELRESAASPQLTTGGGKPGEGYPAVRTGMAVRRLTPRECERLQGFPDDYTLVPHRNKPAADGPRYKALGNSWAVPCARWIGERITLAEAAK